MHAVSPYRPTINIPRMEAYEKRALDKFLVPLREDLDPADVMPHLMNKMIMTKKDSDEINQKTSRPDKVQAIVQILQKKGATAFKAFMEALELKHETLALSLKNEAKMSKVLEKETPSHHDFWILLRRAYCLGVAMLSENNQSFLFHDFLLKIIAVMTKEEASVLSDNIGFPRKEKEKISGSEYPSVEFIKVALKHPKMLGPEPQSSFRNVCRNMQYNHLYQICSEYEKCFNFPDCKISVSSGLRSSSTTSPFLQRFTKSDDSDYKMRFYTKCKGLNSALMQGYNGTLLFKLDKNDNSIHVKIPSENALNRLNTDVSSNSIDTTLLSYLHDKELLQHSSEEGFAFTLSGYQSAMKTFDQWEVETDGSDVDKEAKRGSLASAVPLCLPSNFSWDSKRKLLKVDEREPRKDVKVCEDGFKILNDIGEDLVMVVCITGPARTGKSFFLSQFETGVSFDIGHTVKSQTTGIWINVCKERIKVDGSMARLVLLDAEGQGAVSTADERGNEKWDRKVFSLSTLLCSHLIYNSCVNPSKTDLDKLGLIVQFSEAIHNNTGTLSSGQYDDEFRKVAPHFIWLVRDTLLEPEINGTFVSWHEFVTRSVLFPNKNDDSSTNAIREAISSTFQSVTAFGLGPPTTKKELMKTVSANSGLDKMDEAFISGISCVKSHILNNGHLKKIKGGLVSGEQLANLLSHYVAAVNEHCDELQIDTIWNLSINSQIEVNRCKCLNEYKKSMEKICLPSSADDIEERHKTEVEKAQSLLNQYTKRFDTGVRERAEKLLLEEIECSKKVIQTKNETESSRHCKKVFFDLIGHYFTFSDESFNEQSCEKLSKLKKTMLREYHTLAKGPKVEEIKANNLTELDDKLQDLRQKISRRALSFAADKYEAEFLPKAKEMIPCDDIELEKEKKLHFDSCETTFRKKCDNDCEECNMSRQGLYRIMLKHFHEMQRKNSSESQKYCVGIKETLMRDKFDPLLGTAINRTYDDFCQAKTSILQEYNTEARGPAKQEIQKQLELSINGQLLTVQRLIMDSSLDNAMDIYDKNLKEILSNGPYDTDDLERKEKYLAEFSNDSFRKRCEGISSSEVMTRTKLLTRFLKDKANILKLTNEKISFQVCETEMQKCLRECEKRLRDVKENAENLDMTTNASIFKDMEDVERQTTETYFGNAKGPKAGVVGEILQEIMQDKFLAMKGHVADQILKKTIAVFHEELYKIDNTGPCDEEELYQELQFAAEKVIRLIKERCNFSGNHRQIVEECTKDRLARLMSNKYKQSFENCTEAMGSLLQKFQNFLNQIIHEETSGEGSSFSPANAKTLIDKEEETINQFQNEAKGPGKAIFFSQFKEKVKFYLTEARTCLTDETFIAEQTRFHKQLFDFVKEGPHEENYLEVRYIELRDAALVSLSNLNSGINEANVRMRKEVFNRAAVNLKSISKNENKEMSFKACTQQMELVLQTLPETCNSLSEEVFFNPREELYVDESLVALLKMSLQKFDQLAKGPAKADVRKTCSNKIKDYIVATVGNLIDKCKESAMEDYCRQISRIRFPIEESELDSILNETENAVMQILARQINMRNHDSVESADYKFLNGDELFKCQRELNVFFSSERNKTSKENKLSSLEMCTVVMKNILENRRSFKTKDAMTEAYNELAVGPMKGTVFLNFEEEINMYYLPWYSFLHKRWKQW